MQLQRLPSLPMTGLGCGRGLLRRLQDQLWSCTYHRVESGRCVPPRKPSARRCSQSCRTQSTCDDSDETRTARREVHAVCGRAQRVVLCVCRCRSHGLDSPFATWSFGETLGAGTFGTVHAVVHRATGEAAAAKVLSLSALERQFDARKAVERERSLMMKLAQRLPERGEQFWL